MRREVAACQKKKRMNETLEEKPNVCLPVLEQDLHLAGAKVRIMGNPGQSAYFPAGVN